MMTSFGDKHYELIESVSVWYGFFRSNGNDSSQATGRVLSQLHSKIDGHVDMKLLGYLTLLYEVLNEPNPDEETMKYILENMFEDVSIKSHST